MVTAILLIKAERKKINDVADQLANVEGITEVYSVSGQYDIIAMARVKTNDDLAEMVTSELIKIESIVSTETNLAFRTVSRHDLESMFSIGM